jgi:dephospho-CoA kinase
LEVRGAHLIDTDAVAREVLSSGSPATLEALSVFGPPVQGPGGTLDRAALADLVFSSPESRRRLEAITHPRIRDEVARLRRSLDVGIVVIEIPLLDRDRKLQYALDAVVVVDVPTQVAVARAVQRGMAEPDVRARLNAQPADDERRAIADWTVDNSGSLEQLEQAVGALWAWLCRRGEGDDAGPLST